MLSANARTAAHRSFTGSASTTRLRVDAVSVERASKRAACCSLQFVGARGDQIRDTLHDALLLGDGRGRRLLGLQLLAGDRFDRSPVPCAEALIRSRAYG